VISFNSGHLFRALLGTACPRLTNFQFPFEVFRESCETFLLFPIHVFLGCSRARASGFNLSYSADQLLVASSFPFFSPLGFPLTVFFVFRQPPSQPNLCPGHARCFPPHVVIRFDLVLVFRCSCLLPPVPEVKSSKRFLSLAITENGVLFPPVSLYDLHIYRWDLLLTLNSIFFRRDARNLSHLRTFFSHSCSLRADSIRSTSVIFSVLRRYTLL